MSLIKHIVYIYLGRRLWLPDDVGDACRGDGLDDVGEDEAVCELCLEVPDPLAPLQLVQVVVRPVRVDLDDGLVLLLRRHPVVRDGNKLNSSHIF